MRLSTRIYSLTGRPTTCILDCLILSHRYWKPVSGFSVVFFFFFYYWLFYIFQIDLFFSFTCFLCYTSPTLKLLAGIFHFQYHEWFFSSFFFFLLFFLAFLFHLCIEIHHFSHMLFTFPIRIFNKFFIVILECLFDCSNFWAVSVSLSVHYFLSWQ